MAKASLIFVIVICVLAPGLFSDSPENMEIEIIGGWGNLSYDQTRTSPLSADAGEAFDPQIFPLVLLRFSGELKGLAFNTGFERGPMVKNRLFANVKMDLDYFYFEAGPFLGLFNSPKLPVNPGISATLGLKIPGVIFAQAKGSSTLAFIPMEKRGMHSQYSGELGIGFWVPYVVCSFNTGRENFSQRERTNLLIEDELARYFFRADVYTKNVPYTIRVDLGYQNLSRSYTSPETDGTDIVYRGQSDEFKSLYMGLEGIFSIDPGLRLFLGGEMPVYSWAVRPMKDPPKSQMLYQARFGFIMKLPAGK